MDSNNNNNYSPSSTSSPPHPTSTSTSTSTTTTDPVQSWWESVSKARSRILSLSSILPSHPSSSSFSLSSLADSDRPAISFLSSPEAYSHISSSLSSPLSGSGSDPLCQWLYETYLSSDPNLRLIVLSFLPLLSGIYLSRIHSSDSSSAPSLAGFEAVLLAIYSSEVKSRGGKPVVVQIPHLSQPSLYHIPRNKPQKSQVQAPSTGVLSPPLEPQIAIKSTKRPVIVGVALDCYFKHISQMPSWSKVELCRFAAAWAGQDCACQDKFDESDDADYFLEGRNVMISSNEIEDNSGISESEPKGVRIPLPWEILQPLLRILGHCLLGPLNTQDAKDAASVAVRRLYARGSHDLVPQAILATRSLIQLDKRTRETEKATAANTSSNANTPAKAKKPEILLVSK
ncbi:tetrapeptide repeat homeobox like [Populus alba x Populus x berolinensis]|nr:tetrapeptide repeat homeobox like [Populus alba x Populus x berolinensis]